MSRGKRYLNDEDREVRKRASMMKSRKQLAALYKNDNPFLIRVLNSAGDGLEDVLLSDKGDNRALCNLGCGSSWKPHRHRGS